MQMTKLRLKHVLNLIVNLVPHQTIKKRCLLMFFFKTFICFLYSLKNTKKLFVKIHCQGNKIKNQKRENSYSRRKSKRSQKIRRMNRSQLKNYETKLCDIPIFQIGKYSVEIASVCYSMYCSSIIHSEIIYIRDRVITRQASDLNFKY